MGKFDLGITDTSKRLSTLTWGRTIRPSRYTVSWRFFWRNLRESASEKWSYGCSRNFPTDISVCPLYGSRHLKPLNDSVNEGWNSAIIFNGSRPQLDYCMGFRRSAFTNKYLEKFTPFVGEVTDTFTSYFMATWRMYLASLTCEVRCCTAALDIADRQNAHSMTLRWEVLLNSSDLRNAKRSFTGRYCLPPFRMITETIRIYGH